MTKFVSFKLKPSSFKFTLNKKSAAKPIALSNEIVRKSTQHMFLLDWASMYLSHQEQETMPPSPEFSGSSQTQHFSKSDCYSNNVQRIPEPYFREYCPVQRKAVTEMYFLISRHMKQTVGSALVLLLQVNLQKSFAVVYGFKMTERGMESIIRK